MDKARHRLSGRKSRAARTRKKISVTGEGLRLCVRRSLKHINAQIVDDTAGRSLVQVSSAAKEVAERRKAIDGAGKTEMSRIVGELLAEKASECGIKKVVFDRSGYLYHGRVKALADSARGKGLEF